MPIRPIHDRVLIRRADAESVSKGGIIIPDNAKEKSTYAEVISVGNGEVLSDGTVRPLDVKPGDRILLGKYAGTEVVVDGEKLLMIKEDDIHGVVETT